MEVRIFKESRSKRRLGVLLGVGDRNGESLMVQNMSAWYIRSDWPVKGNRWGLRHRGE